MVQSEDKRAFEEVCDALTFTEEPEPVQNHHWVPPHPKHRVELGAGGEGAMARVASWGQVQNLQAPGRLIGNVELE